jgi:aspartate aminotransferase
MTAIELPMPRTVLKSATYEIMQRVASLRAEGRTILDLATGEPSFATPAAVVEAAERALRDGYTHYTPSAGLSEAREAAADTLARHHGIEVPRERVFMVPSAKYGVFASLAAILQPGDEVVLLGPHWVSYEPMISLLGASARHLTLDAADGYRLDPAALRSVVGSRTRAILVNTPANPTGRVLSGAEIEAIAEVCRDNSCWVISDEIYVRILFDGAVHYAPAAHPELAQRTFTVGGLSKSHAMTGWRIGYVAAPTSALSTMDGVLQNTIGCAPAFVQRAAVVAMRDVDDDVHAMLAEYGTRRDELCAAAAKVPGFALSVPQGALYVWVDVSGTGRDGAAVAQALLEDAGIAVVPGQAFGSTYTDFIRLTYASDSRVVSLASRALQLWA